MPPAHETLDGKHGPARVGHRLALGGLADEPVSFIRKGHHAGGEPIAFLIGDDLDLAPLHDRDHGVGRAQIDADDFFFRHWLLLLSCR